MVDEIGDSVYKEERMKDSQTARRARCSLAFCVDGEALFDSLLS